MMHAASSSVRTLQVALKGSSRDAVSPACLHPGVPRVLGPTNVKPSNTHLLVARSHQADVAVVESVVGTAPASAWDAFAASVCAEWDGVIGTFNMDAEPQQLPEYYVPEAYRDWDVKLYDWQSQCSMFADAEGMKYTLRRLMPTVGCEADAIAFTEEAQEMFSASAAPAISPDGGYTHAPAGLERKDVHKATAEHTFPLSTGQRVRMVHVLKRMGRDQNWRLMNVEVHRERYNDAYNGRRELAGCGGGMDPFATSPALDVGVLEGGWIAEGLRFGPNGAVEAVNGEPWSFEALKNVIGLPLGTWSAGVVVGEDADLAAGVVLDDGRVKVARQVTKGGTLATAELLTLRKAA